MPASVVSRLTHGSAGTFDVDLPLSGKPGVECRTGGGGYYSIVFTFPEMVTFASAAITTAGGGFGGSVTGWGDGSVPSTQVTVTLANVSDGQTIKITLSTVRYDTTEGTAQNDVSVEMGVRVGDVDSNGVVDSTDVAAIGGQIGHSVTSANFRDDINNDGVIGTTDQSLANGHLNQTLNYTTFAFTLDGSYKTSAGVFLGGRLIRTLWSNTYYPQGSYSSTWDGNDDFGVPASPGSYEIRLLQHNVQYIFDGAIGNTSATQVGPGVHNNSCFMRSLALDPTLGGTHAYYAVGECEGEVPVSHFEITAPQTRTTLMDPSIDTGFDIVATDGNLVYVSDGGSDWDYDHHSNYTTFITAKRVSDNSDYAFTGNSATDVTFDSTHTYHKVIDVNVWAPSPSPTPHTQQNPNQPTGLAVQKGATGVLAVAHGGPGGPNQVRLFDKLSGDQIQTISISNPQSMAIDSNGDLWVISGTSLYRYTNLQVPNPTPTVAQTITGFIDPTAVSVSPTNPDLVLVADGGTAQVVRAFNRTATTVSNELWTYGMPGGWDTNGPDVTDNPPKFQFRVGALGTINRIALAVEADGSFLVGDGATSRLLHVNATHDGIIRNDTIMFLTKHTWTAVDPNNPSRVIGDNWLEFNVDYTKPIQTSWTLKKNWAAGVDPHYITGDNAGSALLGVTTLNGHVYGTINDSDNLNQKIVVELPQTANTPLRICKDANGSDLALGIINQAPPPFPSFQQPAWLSPDGAVRYTKWTNPASPQMEFWERTLSGFDGSYNPQWNADVKVASAPYTDLDPSSINDVENIAYPLTSSDKFVVFEPQVQKYRIADGSMIPATGFHLGAIARGDTAWSWRTSRSVTADLPFDGKGSFDLGDGVGIGGMVVKGVGRHLIYSYPGESWNGTEASQWMHYYDDGLFIGQFGTSGDYGSGFIGARPGFSGNSFYSTLVSASSSPLGGRGSSANNDLYLYSNDQTDHSGVIRWHILGANSIREQSGTGALGSTVTLVAPPTSFPTGLTATPGNGQVTLSWNPPNGFSAGSNTVKEATLSGGPYQVVGTTSQTTYTVGGLTNGTEYFFVVSNGTSANSNQVQAYPFDTIGLAGQMTGGLPGGRLSYVPINSVAPAQHRPALTGLDELFGNLSRTSIGTRGYVIYNWADGGSTTSSTPVPYTVVSNLFAPITSVTVNTIPGVSDWFNQNSGASSWFVIDGQPGSSANPCLNLHQGSNGSVDIIVSDNEVHYLSVFSPDINGNQRTCKITLTPKNQSSPSASYDINETPGLDHVLQFLFKGSVTLHYSNVTGPFNSEGGGLQALFFD